MSVERQVDTQSSVDTGVDVGAVAAAVELSVERAALSKSKFETMGTSLRDSGGEVSESGCGVKPSRAGIGLGLPQAKEVRRIRRFTSAVCLHLRLVMCRVSGMIGVLASADRDDVGRRHRPGRCVSVR
jgi:hypothetical protein